MTQIQFLAPPLAFFSRKMKATLSTSIAVLSAAILLLFTHETSSRVPTGPALSPSSGHDTAMFARLPAAFVPNLGQWDHSACFVARIGAMTVFLEQKGWVFTLVERAGENEREKDNASERGVAVRMTFASATEPELVAEDPLPGRHNYFLSNVRSNWRSDVPLYGAVCYREVHPGIDVRVRENDGHFEYDLVLQSCAALDLVEIAVEGVERMLVDEEGAMVLGTRLGPVRMPAPLTWEKGPSAERSLIPCRYVLRGDCRFGFEVNARRPGWELVVDPGLLWSTFLGGASSDEAHAIAIDSQGAVTVAGSTQSSNFPTTLGAFSRTYNSQGDAFITRLSPSGSSLVYSTFLGGSTAAGTGGDSAIAIALDAQGAVTVAGFTRSVDFPTTPGAFDTSYNGGTLFPFSGDVFVTRLSPQGSSLVYSTFLGGTGYDNASGLALDAQGAATVAGGTGSTDFPTTLGAFDTSNGGGSDAFVTKLSPTGANLIYSTYLGGSGDDGANALALDAQGAATVAGGTYSTDFPTTSGAFDTTHNGPTESFVTRFSPTGSSLQYSTFLGGTGTGPEEASALAQNAQGETTIVGMTSSTDFPTTPGAFDRSYNGLFVTKLSSTGASLVYSTFLGGTGTDEIYAVVLDAQGAATVAGGTNSPDFPTTTGAFNTSHSGNPDAFVTRLSPTGSSLLYSTFLGGAWGSDIAHALALDAQGAATVAGGTASTNFPTTVGSFDTTHNGFHDAFVTRLDMLPTGVSVFGRSSLGCTGPLAISVNSMPQVGNASFTLTCGNAPPNTAGLLAFTGSSYPSPLVVAGIEVWVDPSLLSVSASASSNGIGASHVNLPIPNSIGLAGVRLFAQFFWTRPISPSPCPQLGFSASNAIDFIIQP